MCALTITFATPLTYHAELNDAQAALKDERVKVATKDSQIAQLESAVTDITSQANQQQQTISLLVSEKAALTASVERLEDAEASKSSCSQP